MTQDRVADRRRIRTAATRLALACSLSPVLGGALLWGQNVTPPTFSAFDGTTPSIAAPGTPADSYKLSSVESINLSNGHLNISIPLAEIIGRGGARQTLVVHQESHWNIQGHTYVISCPNGVCQYGTAFVATYDDWEPTEPTYAQGAMFKRQTGDWCSQLTGYSNYWTHTITRLTFAAPDGTEYEFRDQLTGGLLQPSPHAGLGWGFDRGRVFVAEDGSGAVFTSSADILDEGGTGCSSDSFYQDVNGTLVLRDGTKYSITAGFVTQIEDRNGNILDLSSKDPTLSCAVGGFCARDALGRITRVSPDWSTITYPGENGATRTVTVTYAAMGTAMANAQNPPPTVPPPVNPPSIENMGQLFPSVPTCPQPNVCTSSTPNDPIVLTQVTLANGQSYKLFYDSFGNVAELWLPTGGYYRYFYGGILDSWSTGVLYTRFAYTPYLSRKEVYLQQPQYAGGPPPVTAAQVILYSQNGSYASLAGHVVYQDGAGTQLGVEDHLSYPVNRGGASLGTDYNGWQQGKEYQANYYAADGTTLLRSEATTWEQRNCTADSSQCWFLKDGTHGGDPNHAPATSVNDPNAPPHDPRAAQKSETVAGGSQSVTSLEKYFYSDATDTYNNQIEADEYGYPSGATLVRKKLTAYQTGSTYTSGPHLISLPTSQTVTDSSGTTKALTCYGYDAPAPQDEPGITAHDSGYGTAFTTRGNATTVSQWLSGTASCSSGTFLTSTYGYDIAGNIVSMLDPRTVKRLWGYLDAGIYPAGFSATSYAFPTSITSYKGLNGTGTAFTAKLTWDYNIAKPLTTVDVNNNTTSYYYQDPLERLTQISRPDTGQTTFTYVDTADSVSVTSSVLQTNLTKITTLVSYDGLGRKSSTNVAAGPTVTTYAYDGRGRQAYTSLPWPGSPPPEPTCISNGVVVSTACTPAYGTLTRFDGINRPTAVLQAGGATTTSQYLADQTLVTDPTGAAKLHTADRDGNLAAVGEDPSAWKAGPLSGSHLNYATNYTYDPLNDLTAVAQGVQSRTFSYDHLKRLLTATNPESGTINYTFDASGNLVQRVDAKNVTTCYGILSGTCNFTVSVRPTPFLTGAPTWVTRAWLPKPPA